MTQERLTVSAKPPQIVGSEEFDLPQPPHSSTRLTENSNFPNNHAHKITIVQAGWRGRVYMSYHKHLESEIPKMLDLRENPAAWSTKGTSKRLHEQQQTHTADESKDICTHIHNILSI